VRPTRSSINRDGAPRDGSKDKKLGIPRRDAKSLLVGVRTEVCPYVGLRKGYSTKLPLIRRWRCGARVVEEPGLRQPDSHSLQPQGVLRGLLFRHFEGG